jgi:hypothetical protein
VGRSTFDPRYSKRTIFCISGVYTAIAGVTHPISGSDKNVLAGITLKKKPRKTNPGQTRRPWDEWQAPFDEIHQIAKQFVLVNALNPEIASIQFDMGCMNV